MPCQNVDFHNQCDHKAISSEKTLDSGVGMSEFVYVKAYANASCNFGQWGSRKQRYIEVICLLKK